MPLKFEKHIFWILWRGVLRDEFLQICFGRKFDFKTFSYSSFCYKMLFKAKKQDFLVFSAFRFFCFVLFHQISLKEELFFSDLSRLYTTAKRNEIELSQRVLEMFCWFLVQMKAEDQYFSNQKFFTPLFQNWEPCSA